MGRQPVEPLPSEFKARIIICSELEEEEEETKAQLAKDPIKCARLLAIKVRVVRVHRES